MVYAAEGVDNHDLLPNVFIPELSNDADIQSYTEGLMNGIPKIVIPAKEKNPEGISRST